MPRWGNWSDPVDLKSAAVKHPGSNPGRGTTEKCKSALLNYRVMRILFFPLSLMIQFLSQLEGFSHHKGNEYFHIIQIYFLL